MEGIMRKVYQISDEERDRRRQWMAQVRMYGPAAAAIRWSRLSPEQRKVEMDKVRAGRLLKKQKSEIISE